MVMEEPSRGVINKGGSLGGGGGGGLGGSGGGAESNRVTDLLAVKEYEAERVDSAFLMMVIPHSCTILPLIAALSPSTHIHYILRTFLKLYTMYCIIQTIQYTTR